MTFTFDLSAYPYNRGVSYYSSNLYRALARYSSDEIVGFGSSLRQRSTIKDFIKSTKTQSKVFPLPPKVLTQIFHTFNTPIETLIGVTDVFHTWDWYLPISRHAKIVTTVHDLALFKFPQIAHPEIKAHHQIVMDRIIKYQPEIIAVSQTTKNDLIELFNINESRITVIPEAVPEDMMLPINISTLDNIRQKYLIHRPFFLMVGTSEPRKNFLNQIKAWRKYKSDYDLVIVGKIGWEPIPNEPGLIHLNNITRDELRHLYKMAELLLFCSLYEGFGLPILEAVANAIPVVTGNNSAMLETAASYTFKADPNSVESIQSQIDKVLEVMSEIDWDDGFIHSSHETTRKYSWKNVAIETLSVYRK